MDQELQTELLTDVHSIEMFKVLCQSEIRLSQLMHIHLKNHPAHETTTLWCHTSVHNNNYYYYHHHLLLYILLLFLLSLFTLVLLLVLKLPITIH